MALFPVFITGLVGLVAVLAGVLPGEPRRRDLVDAVMAEHRVVDGGGER
jgi:hypothetical protein